MERLGTTKSAYKFEKLLAVFGFLLLAIYGLARMYQMFASRAEVRRFWEAQEAPRVQASSVDSVIAMERGSPNGYAPPSTKMQQFTRDWLACRDREESCGAKGSLTN
jgi:hypothetical protein